MKFTSDDKQKTVPYLSGKGACPPEDCGGIYGYEGMKEVFATVLCWFDFKQP